MITAREIYNMAAKGTTCYLASQNGHALMECCNRNMQDYPGDELVVSVAAYDGQLRLYTNQSELVIKHWKNKYNA